MIDVIIPAYNCEGTLKNTVISIEKSGLKKFNIIIVDDGSVDLTKAVCDELMGLYENVSCLFKSNGGVSSARNAGLKKARGEYVLFFDSDDTVDEGAFSDIEGLLSENTPDMLVFGMCFDFYKNGRLYRTDKLGYEKEGLFEKKELLEDFCKLYGANALTSSCNKFIKKALIGESGIKYDENMIILEDLLFSLKLLEKCKTVYCLKKPIYRYRQSENEMNAYIRLEKINDIAHYIEPILTQIKRLNSGDGERVAATVYFMLLYQKLYYADKGGIKKTAESFFESEFSKDEARELLSERDRQLFDNLKKNNVSGIYYKNKKTQIRHKAAVFVKSIIGKVC